MGLGHSEAHGACRPTAVTQGPLDNAARRAHGTERYQGGVVDPQKQGDPDPGYNMDDLGGRCTE